MPVVGVVLGGVVVGGGAVVTTGGFGTPVDDGVVVAAGCEGV
jgi:hypothetical protein